MGKYTVLVNENMGEVNWEMVKKADVHGVMLCVGYGGEVDRLFRANADCCEKLGIPFGVYWTSYAVTERDAQAEKRELEGMKLLPRVAIFRKIQSARDDPRFDA